MNDTKFLNFASFELKNCPELVALGVKELSQQQRNQIAQLTRFQNITITKTDLRNNALEIARIAKRLGATHILFNGYPFFMSYIEMAMNRMGINVVYLDSTKPKGETQYRLKTLIPAHSSELPANLKQEQLEFLS